MKSLRLRAHLLAIAIALPAIAHAHPGHDGDHDLVWDFAHLVAHPLASLTGVSLLVAAGWSVWRLAKSRATAKADNSADRSVRRDR